MACLSVSHHEIHVSFFTFFSFVLIPNAEHIQNVHFFCL